MLLWMQAEEKGSRRCQPSSPMREGAGRKRALGTRAADHADLPRPRLEISKLIECGPAMSGIGFPSPEGHGRGRCQR